MLKKFPLLIWCGMLAACGAQSPNEPPVSDMSVAPVVCFLDSTFTIHPDSDQDGVPVAAAFSARCVPRYPAPNLRPGEDWCPNYKGSAAYHGCVNATTGGSCDVPGLFSEVLHGFYDFSYGFPFGSFCVPDPTEAFRPESQWLTITGHGFDKLGTWLEMKEGQKLATPFVVAVSSCVRVPQAQVTWRLKNGATGKLPLNGCTDRDVPTNCSTPHSWQAQDGCYFSLPMDGSLASLTANDPRINLTLYYPTIDRNVKRYNILTADGQEIPRGFLAEIDCSGTCNF